MALTKVGSVGIATGISLTGVTTTQDAKVGTGITLSPDGDGYYTGIVTATTFKGGFTGNVTGNVTGAASKITVTDQSGDTSCNVLFAQGATGDVTPHTGSNLTFNSSTGALSATSYSGDGSGLTGIAATDNVRTGILDVAGVGTFRNDVNIPDKIIHLGDTNTSIRFPAADTFAVETGGSERVRVDSGGRLLIATTDVEPVSDGEVSKLIVKSTDSTASATFVRHSSDAGGSGIYIGKSRNATIGSNTIVQSGDELGRITFSGDDGTNINTIAARIQAFVDGTPGENDMPGRLTFSTTADGASSVTERLRITSTGDVLIGRTTTSTGHTLCVQADSGAEAVAICGRSGDDIGELAFFENDSTTRLGEVQYRQDYVNFRHRVGSLRWCAAGTVEHMRLDTVTVGSVTTGVLGINDDSPGGDSLALTVKNKNFQETALPVVHIERVNSAGGGSNTDEIALNCRIANSYNNAGDCFAIKSYGAHNLNSTHYAGYFEAKGSQYSAGGDGAGIYAQITKTDTNGGGYVPAAFFYGKHTYNASDTGYAMGVRVKVQALTKNVGMMIHHEQTNSDWTPMIRFCKGSSETEVGTIKSSDTATQYNTSSDYRLKENIVDLTGAITRLKQLKPKRFNFKRAAGTTVDGFIAHEVEPVVPQAVSGTKDATKIETVQDPSTGKTIMLEDGTPKLQTVIDPQEVDYSKLSTLTIAALQEALVKIETLETKVAALESA